MSRLNTTGLFPERHELKTRSRMHGFTLIELLITVAVIGILLAVALPSYRTYIERGQRANAKTVLLEAAQFMERHRSSNFKYVTANGDAPALPDRLQISPSEGSKNYDIALVADATSFTLTAYPSGWTDTLCGNLTLNNLGEKGPKEDVATCWNR